MADPLALQEDNVDCGSAGDGNIECATDGTVREQLTAVHVSIMFGLFILTFLLYVLISTVRQHRISRRVNAIPNGRLRVPVGRKDMSKRIHKQVVDQFARMTSDSALALPAPANPIDRFGWGRSEDRERKVHLKLHHKSNVVRSFGLLESAVLAKYPSMARKRNQTVRDYLALLKAAFPGVTPGDSSGASAAWDAYIEAYERAKYGDAEFTAAEYEQFKLDFFDVYQHVG